MAHAHYHDHGRERRLTSHQARRLLGTVVGLVALAALVGMFLLRPQGDRPELAEELGLNAWPAPTRTTLSLAERATVCDMCVNCVSTVEVVAGQVGLAAAVLRAPVHNLLASAGLVPPIDLVKRDVRTVAFVRSLDLDPVEMLGAEVVTAADGWVPAVYEPRRWARPIGSQSLLTAQ